VNAESKKSQVSPCFCFPDRRSRKFGQVLPASKPKPLLTRCRRHPAGAPAGYSVLRGRVNLLAGNAYSNRGNCCHSDQAFWILNFCKIVYVIDEEGPVRRVGFAYGTLPEHAEQGEERFAVERHRMPNVVSYDILSFSRPVSLAARVAYPLARRLQMRSVRQSLAALEKAVKADQVPFE
jgi:hypothetical protein